MIEKDDNVTSIEKEMKQSYLEYAMSVIIGRALPDVRDGLKPVHRRVLFAMRQLKNDWNKPYKKSARVVGDVIGKYHPHGDSAVYDTIVRMAQNFSLRYTLVDGQGNFGSVDGDSPAAMRYTEIRMRKLAHQMLTDLEKETVDWVPNYDETMEEPSVLPTKFPALLVNGSSGIAVGMTTNIPPHNIGEVCDAIMALLDNPELDIPDIMQYIPGPDFPTYGIIHGKKGIYDAYTTGRGVITVRAKMEVEVNSKTKKETIVVTELPYQVNKARLVEKIDELMREKVIEGASFVRDESDRQGMRIAIGLKRDQIADVVINQLYKHTYMQTGFGIIFLAVVNKRPQLFTIKEILEHFIEHRKEVIVRRTLFDLKKAEERAHILEGLKKALDHLDEIVALIRASASPDEAKEALTDVNTFAFSMIQAQAILEMRLQRLTGLEREKIVSEYEAILKDIAWFNEILGSEAVVRGIIKDEMIELKTEYSDDRRTEIVEDSGEINIEDLIAEEDMVVTISRSGYIKRNPVSLYTSQHRGGKGKMAMGTKEDDFVEHLFVASTHHTFLFITNMGKVYQSKVYELPMAGRSSLGKAIVNLLNFDEGEQLATVLTVPEFEDDKYVIMATRMGRVKKTDLMAYSRPRSGGLIGIKLADDDELIAARISDGTMDIFLGSRAGKVIRFHEQEIRTTARGSMGVRGMRIDEDGQVVGMEVLSHGKTLLTVTENGYGKRSYIEDYRAQTRGGKGVFSIRTSKRNGMMVNLLLVEESDELMLVTDKGKLIRTHVEGISIISRNTQGVRLINLSDDEKLIAVARLPEDERDSDNISDEDNNITSGENDQTAKDNKKMREPESLLMEDAFLETRGDEEDEDILEPDEDDLESDEDDLESDEDDLEPDEDDLESDEDDLEPDEDDLESDEDDLESDEDNEDQDSLE
ncbi:DNA gyrase (type II topoisomerase), subunit A [Desulfamplus magnetovallimortis]|uniref:DNA gyrase subunit A n=1 Tax=Desulfamplus magnetovallimortis TaxID=1246637 RepID=A0A1W1H5U5_9BACT|nr:DNA gyrase subunit A [Desulfamplus magnetovallimortis]SLM27806.1 DNA gyrase (type II topoisomerase), subunit A [Desulfamplus magnetovallimortis]